ncbi:hypothetical protein OSTOST_02196 [Ostertagia ostertagi]
MNNKGHRKSGVTERPHRIKNIKQRKCGGLSTAVGPCLPLSELTTMDSAAVGPVSNSMRNTQRDSFKNRTDFADRLKQMAEEESLLQNKALREENDSLKKQLRSLEEKSGEELSPRPDQKQELAGCESSNIDSELDKSIVISGVPENQSPNSTDRAYHDLQCISSLLNFLGVECLPSSVYRMGLNTRPRLLKLVLPNSRFQKEMIKRAPRLRFFPQRGVHPPIINKRGKDP